MIQSAIWPGGCPSGQSNVRLRVSAQAGTRSHRRRPNAMPATTAKPIAKSDQVPGSGMGVADTLSSKTIGGTLVGFPFAKKDNTSLVLVGVNVKVSLIHPLKPCSGMARVSV